MATRNNVIRLLESRNISYEAFYLPTDKKVSAIETARFLVVDEEMVFKTIVLTPTGKGKPILAVVPAPDDVNLKLVAGFLNEKKVNVPTQKEAERITGLEAGGISPLSLIQKRFRVIIDLSAKSFSEIHISGGQRGLNIRLSIEALAELVNASFANIRTR
jgi:Cys-tRNA(Pro)/Cys-tRNA(Cys) deacylase